MPKARRAAPPVHILVVDTNILWDRDKKLPVCTDFEEFWKRNSQLIPLELHVPEVVLGELRFQQTTSALKALSNIKDAFVELSGIAQSTYTHRCNEADITTQVKAKLLRWIKSHSGVLVPTPIQTIDWASVVDAAIWRKPPFTFDAKEKNNEKGFRDALILETLANVCDNAGPGGKAAIFVCNDDLLRTTAEARLKNSKLLAFESLTDFEAYINLTQQQLTDAFVKAIQKHARSKFYQKGDPNCIYLRLGLRSKILTGFTDDLAMHDHAPTPLGLLGQAFALGTWTPIRRLFRIGSTRFLKLIGTREFHWTSRLDVVQLFERQMPTGLTVSPLPHSRTLQACWLRCTLESKR